MDQIKEKLAVALKYGFWIGSAVVFVGSLGVWFWSTTKLADESASQTQKIKSAIQTVSGVEMELPEHPNDLSHEKMNELIAIRQDEVLKSWKTLFDRQRNILTWPVDKLKEDFVKEYRDKLPIEVFVESPTPEEDELETTLLVRYQRYIKNALPDIAKMAKTEWEAEFESVGSEMGMSGMGGGMGGMDMGMGMGGYGQAGPRVSITGATEGPLVKWSSSSQSALLSDLFPWRGSVPSTLEVYYSQENLWVLTQLMQIIAEVNGDARQPYQAKIHEINTIAIGSSVKNGSGTISLPGANATGGMGGMGGMDGMDMMGMDMGMDSGMDMGMDSGMDMGMGGGGLGFEAPDPAENRYVNEAMEPIAAADLRAALNSNLPSDVSLAVAKRVPVMMSVKMDQRFVPELLAACGSAPLMVQVTQVRVLPPGTSASAGMDMGMGMGDEMSGGMGGGMDMGMGGGMSQPNVTKEPVKEFPLDMAVEIYGVINIYNPPDPDKLALDQVTKENVDELIEDPKPSASTNDELPVPQANPAGEPPAATDPNADPAATPPAATDPATPPATTPATTPAPTDPATTPAPSDPAAADPAAAPATPDPAAAPAP
ncbi:hypothetical protein K227x_52020 [Rubripirellula lacrimiformis]|uniref:Uncharacterized protein n=1 Tax=Rubripirellula lacrimiformis TaxID=1930273 RepID=A0A517NI24_9BACT|nr:hypothetical protein [Rubripirellula lacrimiformis]QDT06786.1 hypothetical protein K227x_52020 [Rubripirellula lacrimiformis]